MKSKKTCAKCGTAVSADMPGGFCSICLFRTGLGLLDEENSEPGEVERRSPPMREFGDYDLLEEIGRGGQGVIYRARQKSLNRTVALKVVGLGHWASTPHLKRFRQEAEAAARLEHPQIVPIYEIGERDGSCYFSMKFIDGEQLGEIVKGSSMAPRRAAGLIATIARTVQFAHERGVLHRDIKPGNILLDRSGEPHLTDFGLARLLEDESTVTNSFDVLGTPSYMAPEQAAGQTKTLTAAADIYSLGALFYQMLTGQPPFAGGTSYETVRLLLENDPPSPRLLNPKVDRDLSTICLKCLEKVPKDRYETAVALAEDVERWFRHEPIRARRIGVFGRGRKWIRRNPAPALFAGTLVALLLAIGGIFWEGDFFRPPRGAGIAVLPFENLSEDKSNAYLADGIQNEILTRLSKIAGLKVISRSSTQNYESAPRNVREIGRQLGVAHILEGSVQKNGDAVRVSVQLIRTANGSHLWADTLDRKLTDIFSVESDVAKAIAEQLRAHLSNEEQAVIATRPTDKAEAYDAYLRGLAYSLKPIYSPANALGARRYLKEAVRLDPKFALAWALLSYVDARGYITRNLQPTPDLNDEARQAAETALSLQPNLGEAVVAKGYYHYACLKDYETALRYYEQARELLPNSSRIPESLAYVTRRRGEWARCESYFNEAERLDPRNVYLLTQHAQTYIVLRRFSEALRKLDRVLNITPDDPDNVALTAGIAQAEGDLTRAASLLAPLRLAVDDPSVLETQIYQAILERRTGPIIPQLEEIIARADPALGYYKGELRVWLGWAQEVAGEHAAARQNWQQARSELEASLKEQPDNNSVHEDLALANMFLGDKAVAFALAEAAMAAIPIEKDALTGPRQLEILARVAAQTGETDRAIAALQKLLAIPYSGALVESVPLTPAFLRLDPMFDPLRGDPRFEKIATAPAKAEGER